MALRRPTSKLLARPHPAFTPHGLARALGGRSAKLRGRNFEDELEASCMVYRLRGLATIARCHPPVAGVPGQMFFTGHGHVDFIGTWDGQPIAFDAKVRGEQLPMTFSLSERDRFQAAWLCDFAKCGGVACILLRSGDECAILRDMETLAAGGAIPVRGRATKGARSVTNRLVPVVHRDEGGLVPWDFLQVLREELELL